MVIGVAGIRLFIRSARSLKDKRRVLQSLKERLRSRFNVAVSEVGFLDEHQIAEIAVASVSNDRAVVERTLQNVRIFLEGFKQALVSSFKSEYY